MQLQEAMSIVRRNYGGLCLQMCESNLDAKGDSERFCEPEAQILDKGLSVQTLLTVIFWLEL